MCGKMEVTCHIKEGFQSVATSALEQLRQQSTESALQTLDSATFWLRPEITPTLGEQHGNTWTNSGTVEFLQHNLLSVTAAVFGVAVLIAGMRIAWEQRARPLQELLKAILTFVVVAGAGTATMHLLTTWADGFAVEILGSAAKEISLAPAFGGTPGELVAATMPTLLAISINLSVILASLVQLVLMLVRSALLVLLAGAFPLAAAATNTEIGRTWFRKFCGWSLAFIAYKPAAALVYAAALKATKDPTLGGGDAVVSAMTGMMMLLLAIFALPALLRFMVPVTAAVAGGAAGMGSSIADPGGLATGAVNVGSSGAGRGSGSARSAGGSSGGGAGATGAQLVGAKVAGPAGVGLAVARKTAGGVAGATSHSTGESGGGSITPPSAAGPMAGRSGARGRSPKAHGNSSAAAQERVPEPAGPSGGW